MNNAFIAFYTNKVLLCLENADVLVFLVTPNEYGLLHALLRIYDGTEEIVVVVVETEVVVVAVTVAAVVV